MFFLIQNRYQISRQVFRERNLQMDQLQKIGLHIFVLFVQYHHQFLTIFCIKRADSTPSRLRESNQGFRATVTSHRNLIIQMAFQILIMMRHFPGLNNHQDYSIPPNTCLPHPAHFFIYILSTINGFLCIKRLAPHTRSLLCLSYIVYKYMFL